MTLTRPPRLTVRQCMQIFLTEAFTFMLIVMSGGRYERDLHTNRGGAARDHRPVL